MPPSAFPNTATVGQTYLKFTREKADWDAVTIKSTYEDSGADFNLSATVPSQRWTLEYGGLTETQAKVLDDHFDSAQGQVFGFSYTEPRNYPWSGTTGTAYTDVHYESYERSHDPKLWTQTRKIVLIKRPS